MAENTKIEWTDDTWNPTVGCSVISPGCTNCYAMKMAARLEAMGSPIYRGHTIKTKAGAAVWNGKVSASSHDQMIKPLSWMKGRFIFVNSMSDLFHLYMPVEIIDRVFAVMALCPQHIFQLLTKRSARMRAYVEHLRLTGRWLSWKHPVLGHDIFDQSANYDVMFRHVWLGVSVEDQRRAEERIPDLLATPASVRFLSCEPLLGPLRLDHIRGDDHAGTCYRDALRGETWHPGFGSESSTTWRGGPRIDWCIIGGESGPGRRPVDLEWMRALRDQCAAAGTACFVKQIDKVIQVPPDLRIREFPNP